uniref:Fibronectin type-III domain-containing protein n=1 Tax=Macaca fascicularis TaxID=9541 RepID=A0A7N9ICU3_MACFA
MVKTGAPTVTVTNLKPATRYVFQIRAASPGPSWEAQSFNPSIEVQTPGEAASGSRDQSPAVVVTVVTISALLVLGSVMSVLAIWRRPCSYGKGGGDAHDEEELYFHCELAGPGWGGAGSTLPHSSALCLAPLHEPACPPQWRRPRSLGSSLSLPVKVPTRRTFLDPQSCGDPLQAVHLFAKELDAKSVTLERRLGAGKLGAQEDLSPSGSPTHSTGPAPTLSTPLS